MAAVHTGTSGGCPASARPLRERRQASHTDAVSTVLLQAIDGLNGFDTREDWTGWDMVRAMMPESEVGNLIVEVRSATAGVGSFTFKFDHMSELTGRTADQVIAARKAAAAAA